MRRTETEPELRLENEIKEFYARHQALQATTGQSFRERFEAPLNLFEMRWQDRINDLELGELRGCRRGVTQAVERLELSSRQLNNDKDLAAIRGLDRDPQYLIWNSTNRAVEISPLLAKERQEQSDTLYKEASATIVDRYAKMRDTLEKNVQAMLHGREPSVARQNPTTEREPSLTVEQYRDLRRAELQQEAERELAR